MLRKLKRLIEDSIDDVGYLLKRSTAFVLGKGGGQAFGLFAGAGIGALAGFDPGLKDLTIEMLGAGAIAGVSAGMVQADFLHGRAGLADRYREELGALLHKAPDKVQEADLELAARGDFKNGIAANSSLRRELRNTWLNRNVSVVLAAVATAATFISVHIIDDNFFGGSMHSALEALKEVVPALGLAVEHPTGTHTLGSALTQLATSVARNGFIGLVIYHGLKTPAHWAASEYLGIDEHTVNDHITEIKRTLGRGKEVEPEEVLATFIHAHNDIREQVAAEHGKEFDAMNHEEKHELLQVVEQYMDVQHVTDDINKGRMRPEELIFAAYGQSSGVEIGEEGSYVHQGNVLDNMWQGLTAITGGYSKTADDKDHVARVSEDIASGLDGTTSITVNTPDADHASMHLENESEEPGKKQSFVARVGRSVDRGEDGQSHVERLEQSASHNVVVTPS